MSLNGTGSNNMLIYLIYAPLNILLMLLCYLTNPIVVLFADERGELHGFLKYWQTWDDSLDPAFYVKKKVPKFLRYDYDRHYQEYWNTTPKLAGLGRDRCFVKLIDKHFTVKERIQRYFCRVLWLARNCGYGFAFYVFGRKVVGKSCFKKIYRFDSQGHYVKYLVDKTRNVFLRPWSYKNTWKINKKLRWEVYLGWKINEDQERLQQCMIAHRIALRSV